MSVASEEIIEGAWDVDNETYHADTSCVSSSSLKEFLDWVPTYHQRYVLGTMPRKEPSEAMTLGSAIHCAILEPEKYPDQYCTAPVCDRRTKGGKETWEGFVADNKGKTVLSADQQETVAGCVEAFQLHKIAGELDLSDGWIERGFRWLDRSGAWCKCKPDYIRKDGLIVDLKTVSSLNEKKLMAQAAELRYHMQAAMYLDGIQSLCSNSIGPFYHVCLLTAPPYGVVAYELGADSLNMGRELYQSGLRRLVDCRLSGDWSDPKERDVNKWNIPRWALTQEAY